MANVAGIFTFIIVLILAIFVFNLKMLTRSARTKTATALIAFDVVFLIVLETSSLTIITIGGVIGLLLILYIYRTLFSSKNVQKPGQISQKEDLTITCYVVIFAFINGKFGLTGYQLDDIKTLLKKSNIFRRKWDEALAKSAMKRTERTTMSVVPSDIDGFLNKVKAYNAKH